MTAKLHFTSAQAAKTSRTSRPAALDLLSAAATKSLDLFSTLAVAGICADGGRMNMFPRTVSALFSLVASFASKTLFSPELSVRICSNGPVSAGAAGAAASEFRPHAGDASSLEA